MKPGRLAYSEPGRCVIRINEQPCGETAVYRIWFGDCATCRIVDGLLWCAGHAACVACTAEMRTNDYEFSRTELDGSDVSPSRVCGIEVT